MTRVAVTMFAALALLACNKTPESSKPPVQKANAPTKLAPADAAATKPFQCGGAMCTAGQFCEERSKGHAVDDQGRPLQKKKCMTLPAPCGATATCDCVTKHIAATHCRATDGQVYTDDYRR
jgi:hypothetical protein